MTHDGSRPVVRQQVTGHGLGSVSEGPSESFEVARLWFVVSVEEHDDRAGGDSLAGVVGRTETAR